MFIFGIRKLVISLFILLLPALVLSSQSHYDTLGIKKTATESEIKKAYRGLALKWHPDKAAEKDREEATKQFQKISEAYEVLSDKDQRRQYDAMGEEMPSHHQQSNQGSRGGNTHYEQHFNFNHKSPEDVFKEFFGTDNPFDKMFENVGQASAGAGGMGGAPMGDLFSAFGGMGGGGLGKGGLGGFGGGGLENLFAGMASGGTGGDASSFTFSTGGGAPSSPFGGKGNGAPASKSKDRKRRSKTVPPTSESTKKSSRSSSKSSRTTNKGKQEESRREKVKATKRASRGGSKRNK